MRINLDMLKTRRLKIDTELPMKDQYGEFVAKLIEAAHANHQL